MNHRFWYLRHCESENVWELISTAKTCAFWLMSKNLIVCVYAMCEGVTGKFPVGKLPVGKFPVGKLPLWKTPSGKTPSGKIPSLENSQWLFKIDFLWEYVV